MANGRPLSQFIRRFFETRAAMDARAYKTHLAFKIKLFAAYGFNKAHSVCYALIGYQTAYLKAHYPVEFMTALLNADKGDVLRISFLTQEATKIGTMVLPPDINASARDFMRTMKHTTGKCGKPCIQLALPHCGLQYIKAQH